MKVIKKERQWIENYKLPSFRWRKRRIKKDRDKKLIQLQKEYFKINTILGNLGYEELHPPIRKGYVRLFVLREDVRYGKDADFYQNILDKINTYQYSNSKKFKVKRKKKRTYKHKHKLVEKQQKLWEPNKYHFNKLEFSDKEKRLFILIKYYSYAGKGWKEKYVFSEPWRFILKIRPYYITKSRIHNRELEKRRDEISKIIHENRKNNHRLQKIKPHSNRWKLWLGEKNKYKFRLNPIKNNSLYKIWEVYEQEIA